MPTNAPIAPPHGRLREGAPLRLPPGDVLVFEHREDGFTLVGGSGRGAGWAGIVELDLAEAVLVGAAWRRGTAERIAGVNPVQIAGPYYARHAVAVPVGHEHVVVFGSNEPILARDSELVERAARAATDSHGVSADKLLADELEVVQALRSLTAYQPLTVRDTARHIATVAGQALSCEVAVIRIEIDERALVEGLDLRSMSALANPDTSGHLATMVGSRWPVIEQVAPTDPDVFGVDVASRMLLPLAGDGTGALALGHATTTARGFTSLCQRIGRAIADASEILISQARAREQLATERELLTRLLETDALTGVANRRAWEDIVSAWTAGRNVSDASVISCDVDGLKAANDRYGHDAGDAIIRGAASLLRSCVRETDVVARIGGDEFAVLVAPADVDSAGRIVARIRRAQKGWRVTEHGLQVRLSVGAARIVGGDIVGAFALADRSMYATKRRRARLGTAATLARGDRRSAPGSLGRP